MDQQDIDVVIELLGSYEDNCKNVETNALQAVSSLDVAVFNGLRDMSPFNLLLALRRIENWFGKVRSLEHSVCLVVLTEYISCAYNERSLYKTFSYSFSEKFIDSLFQKLYFEWTKVFVGPCIIDFSVAELESIRKSLLTSVGRFSESFRHKGLLNNIVELCENYRYVLLDSHSQNINSNVMKSDSYKEPLAEKIPGNNLLNKSPHMLMKKRSAPDISKYMVRKKLVAEVISNETTESSTIDNENICVDIRQMTPVAEEKIDVNISSLQSESIPCVDVTNISNSINERDDNMKKENNVTTTSASKLNAFDILMRRKGHHNRKRVC